MKNRIKRHSLIEIIEHWSVAISGIVLLFTGLGCLPLYKRYYITEIPGFAWTADFYYVTLIHYIAAIFFVSAVVFHIFYHGLRKDFALLPKKGDIKNSVKVLAAMIGLGKEPPSDKYLPEQRIAYVGIGFVILVLTVTGIIKVLRNLEWIILSPQAESINTIVHTLSGFIFILAFIVHVGTVILFRSNWPLLKSIFTGYVDEEYAKHRHSLWYERIIRK
ncbi:formate dehydrogenase subunit gamma [Thermodesulfovibrio hydrogeniphilus]